MAIKENADYAEYLRLFPAIQQYQALASKYNIRDIFQDNGGKYLQLLMLLGLQATGSREGNDAFDAEGREYEIKTVNVDLTRSFSTHHHMNPVLIVKYRKVDWYFAVYRNIELQVIYRLRPADMEPFYSRWESKWRDDGEKDINNPKVPLAYVIQKGEVIWLPEGAPAFEIPKKESKQAVERIKRKKKPRIDLDDL